MATSSRQSAIFGVNDWQAIYQTFREADFKSYDYETLRKSFIDYLRVYLQIMTIARSEIIVLT